MALSEQERTVVQDAMQIALREGKNFFHRGASLATAELWAKPIFRAVLEASTIFTKSDINKMVDTFKMKMDEEKTGEDDAAR